MKMVLSKRINSRQQMLVFTLLVVVCMFLGGCGEKAQKKKLYCVGIVSGVETFVNIADGFKTKMTELGYVEGENIVYDLQQLNADPVGEQRVAEKFVHDKVDLIFAFPTEPAVAAKAATQGTDIPVVFAMAGIEGNDLVESVAKPGGNITGVRYPGPELTVKRLDILHELVPQAKRILITYDPNYPTIPTALSQLRPAALSMGLTLVEDPVKNLEQLKASLQKKAASADIGIDAILIMPEVLTQSPDGWAIVSKFAAKHKLPIAGSAAFEADTGALFSYIPDLVEIGKLAAALADKIFKGTPAGTIMVVTPDSRLRLNYKLIQELGLKVSEGLLSRADEVIR
jgi:putative ABC transport system substrate-binding protein